MNIGAAPAAAHERIELIAVPDAGHAPWFDDPETIARAIETVLTV